MFSLEETIDKIAEHARMPRTEILKLVEEKEEELSGLVSKEGAAYLVGRELGINLLREGKKQLKVKNLVSGLRSVDLVVRVVRIFEPRDFDSRGRKGTVQSIIVGDETGTIRFPFWNEEVQALQDLHLKEDDTIKITGAFVTPNRDGIELRLGRAAIEKAAEPLPDVLQQAGSFLPAERHLIAELQDGSYGEVRGSLVHLFRRNPFYEVCPTCRARVKQEGDRHTCPEHGAVMPAYRLVLAGILDDGSGNIRAVFFGEQAERLLGKTTREVIEIAKTHTDPLAIYAGLDCLGGEFLVRGRVRMNSFSSALELIANEVEPVDVIRECGLLLKSVRPSP